MRRAAVTWVYVTFLCSAFSGGYAALAADARGTSTAEGRVRLQHSRFGSGGLPT
jgi:hypothetical protein